MNIPKTALLVTVALVLSSCAKMTEIQPNNELLPEYSAKNHTNRVSLNSQAESFDMLAAEWVDENTLALVTLDAQDEDNLTRDSIACEFFSLEAGEKAALSETRRRKLKERVLKAHMYKKRKVPEDEQETDEFFVQWGDDYFGADYLTQIEFYSQEEDYSLSESQKIQWKGALYTGSGAKWRIRDASEKKWNYGEMVAREDRWDVDLHPSGRYLRLQDNIYDIEKGDRYEIQKGYLWAYYAFSPSWDQLLVVHGVGNSSSVRVVDIVDFDLDNLRAATPADSSVRSLQ